MEKQTHRTRRSHFGIRCVLILFPFILTRSFTQDCSELERFTSHAQMRQKSIEQAGDSMTRAGSSRLIRLDDGTPLFLERIADGEPHYLMPFNTVAARAIRTDITRDKYGLTGAGVLVGQWDFLGVYTEHPELRGGRVQQMDGALPDTSIEHATHVACTIGGFGVNPLALGMAKGCRINCYDFLGGDTFRMANEVLQNNLQLSCNAYGEAAGWIRQKWYGNANIHPTIDYKFGYYDYRSHDWDSLAVLAPHFLIIKPAGNSRGEGGPIQPPPSNVPENNGGNGGYDCLSTFGVAKNILTVGAIDGKQNPVMTPYSSWGPADDGRIKPDILAHGEVLYSASNIAVQDKPNGYSVMSGTSQAAASVVGSLALLLELQHRLDSTELLRSSTMKALVLHTADEFGSPGPDYQSGWGIMNTERAAGLLVEHQRCGGHMFNNLFLGNADSILIPFRATGDTLKATICWTDLPAIPLPLEPSVVNNPTPRLVHDLDLRISGPGGIELPWTLSGLGSPSDPARKGDNTVDNIEQVVVPSHQPGETYAVSVHHKGSLLKPQPVSLILTGNCRMAVSAGTNISGCNGDSVRLSVDISCGTGPFQFEWSPADSTMLNPFSQNPTVICVNQNSVPLLRTYTVTVRDGHGCVLRDSVTVLIHPRMELDVQAPASVCAGEEAQLRIVVQGGTPPFSYRWEPASLFNDPASSTQTIRPIITTTYTVTVTDMYGCTETIGPLPIIVHPTPLKPTITQLVDTLSSSTGTSYRWYFNSNTISGADSSVFVARRTGFYQVAITDTNGCPAISDSLFVRVHGSIVIQIPVLEGDPGKSITVPVLIRTQRQLDEAGADSCSITVEFLRNILAPTGRTASGSILDSLRIITVRGQWNAGDTTLASFELLPMLGDIIRTSIHIDRIDWDGAPVSSTLIDGEFELRICREGGDRLFDASRIFSLRQNFPNPFNAETVIGFDIIEQGYHRLSLWNSAGEFVQTLISDWFQPGSYSVRLDGSALPSGHYWYTLHTPSQVRMRALRLVK